MENVVTVVDGTNVEKQTPPDSKPTDTMNTKIAVVTGSNKGIGFAIVRGLCKRFPGLVYLTSRNEKRGLKAVEDLKKEGLNPNYHQLDITSTKSIETFRDYIKEKYGGIDVLVNNAAIAFKSKAKEPVSVQAEETIFVNYFSVLSTCEILFPIMRNGGRVVNISSSCGHLSHIPSEALKKRFTDPNLTILELSDLMRQYVDAAKQGTQLAEWGNSSYVVSKVGVTALTKIQQKMLKDRDIKVNAVHPGYVNTDMSSHKGPLTIDEGAEAPLYLALDAPDSVQGEYVWYNKKIVSWTGERAEEKY
ncbi:carbonyl reductase [NADPH] 3-like [Amyelois transitella]|uniref:carbonyl reductase [NADPH] 3-like n=1 Tax=Amyelois transitella TaxID=680683 RepID=UPI00298FCE52|nr:carbonyl reductase [NADPH] 3-like [Amyelois transitella]